jgi:PBP4 family serine-type D-alanyl-D-alanine carboxypeptidase
MTHRYNKILFLFVFLLVFVSSFACSQVSQSIETKDPIAQIDEFINGPLLKNSLTGILIQSLRDDRIIYSHESDRLYMPASNLKLVTSAAILDALGPDHLFKIEILFNGNTTKGGKLNGDLILRGTGDPTLSTEDLSKMVTQIKAMGINRIIGNLIVDDTYFDDQRLGWGWCWEDEPYYYSPQISAICLNENTISFEVKPGKAPGLPVVVTMDPETTYMPVECSAVTGPAKSETSIDISRRRGRNVTIITGIIPSDGEPVYERITVEDPAIYAGEILAKLLRSRGVTITGKVKRARTPSGSRAVLVHNSLPLSKMLPLLNKPSNNLFGECFFRHLAACKNGIGSTDKAVSVVNEFLKKTGADPSKAHIVDGSGLSRLDIISPDNLVAVLRYMANSPNAKVYQDSLPIAGVDGSLQNRLKGTLAEGNVHAKTGYVLQVCTLSGYVTTKGGEPLVFSLLMNHYTCTKKEIQEIQDQICKILAEMP